MTDKPRDSWDGSPFRAHRDEALALADTLRIRSEQLATECGYEGGQAEAFATVVLVEALAAQVTKRESLKATDESLNLDGLLQTVRTVQLTFQNACASMMAELQPNPPDSQVSYNDRVAAEELIMGLPSQQQGPRPISTSGYTPELRRLTDLFIASECNPTCLYNAMNAAMILILTMEQSLGLRQGCAIALGPKKGPPTHLLMSTAIINLFRNAVDQHQLALASADIEGPPASHTIN